MISYQGVGRFVTNHICPRRYVTKKDRYVPKLYGRFVASGTNLKLAAVHGCPWRGTLMYLNLTFMNN